MPFTSRLLVVALLAPVAVPAAPRDAPGPLDALAFMAGCWRGAAGGGRIIEEHYTPPSANLILGMTRYLREGTVTGYEFTTIAWQDSAIVMTPRPDGQAPVPFRLTSLEAGRAAWENPQHDFPTRIVYRRAPGDTLVARIEGPGSGGTRAEEWRMGRARCEG